MKCGRKHISRPCREYRADDEFSLSTLSLIILLCDQHDTTQLTNITHCPFVWKGKLPLRWASVRTVCVCVWVQVLSVCVRLSVTSVTSALQLHRRRHCECLRGILRVQRVTGCVTAVSGVLPLPCCLWESVWHWANTDPPSGLKRSHSERQLLVMRLCLISGWTSCSVTFIQLQWVKDRLREWEQNRMNGYWSISLQCLKYIWRDWNQGEGMQLKYCKADKARFGKQF